MGAFKPNNSDDLNAIKIENEKLKEQLESLKKTKKFGLVWEDKEETVQTECIKKYPVLKECAELKIDNVTNKNLTTNLIIEGDNYHSLLTLQWAYKSKIDMIYIDPPYNTGNKDFIYNDSFVDKEDGFRHTKWLSFMEKRLKLAKELLSDKGVIFISIDDNEQAYLKLLCDEVFGERNLLGNLCVVNNFSGRSDDKFFATANEYVCVYSKNIKYAQIFGIPLNEEQQKEYKLRDKISKYKLVGLKKSGKNSKRSDRPNMYYPIYYDEQTNKLSLEKEKGSLEILPTTITGDGCWRWGKETFLEKYKTELVCKKIKDEYVIYVKMRMFINGKLRELKPKTFWQNSKYSTTAGGNTLKGIFEKKLFDSPKAIDFIKDILFVSGGKYILDFFAGSGTTGQAVLELNKQDGGNRKFILCTNNENNIAKDICYQRIKTVITGKRKDNSKYSDGIPANLRYFKTDFVQKDIDNDQTKVNITECATELIQIKEDAYTPINTIVKNLKLFENAKTVVAIIFDRYDDIDDSVYKNELKNKQNNKVLAIYRFSINANLDMDISGLDNTRIEPIPEEILKLYRQNLKSVKEHKMDNERK
jgi:adenine-specific DNA-methyltransferase